MGFTTTAARQVPQAAMQDPRYDLGYLVVTYYDGVNPNGTGDSHAGIQQAIDDAYENKLVVYFPSGTYLVSDVLKCYHWALWDDKKAKASNPPWKKAHVLRGASTDSRPVIKLTDDAQGFDDPENPRPVIVWRYFKAKNANGNSKVEPNDPLKDTPEYFKDRPANIFGWEVQNIDIDLNTSSGTRGNKGAIGGAFKGAQYSGIFNMKINAEGGHCGIKGVPGRNSFITNIEVEGGRYGIINTGGSAGSCLAGAKLYNQTEYAITSEDFCPYSVVGFDIVTEAPKAIVVGKGWSSASGAITLIDGKITMEGDSGTAVDNTVGRNIHLSNVYVWGADTLVIGGNMTPIAGSNDWMHIIEYTYNDLHSSDDTPDPPVYSTSSLINGVRSNTAEPSTRTIEADAPPQNLISRHTWNQLPSYEGENGNTINVKEAPYNAKGDGETDDREAIQQAIDDAQTEIVFLPKGNYVINRPLRLKSNTKLIGVNQNYSNLVSTSSWSDGSASFMIKTDDDANATTFFGFIGFEDEATAPNNITGGFIDWKAGRSSMIMMCRHGKKWGSYNGTEVRYNYKFSGNGGGRHYIAPHREQVASNSDSRHVYIQGTSEPLTFYGLNVESTKPKGDNPDIATLTSNIEIVNASNVRIHSIKREGDSPTIIIRDSRNISIYGMGRLNKPIPSGLGGYNQITGNCSDILFATIVLDRASSPEEEFPLLTENLEGENEINIEWPSNLSLYKRGELSDIYNLLLNHGFESGDNSDWDLGAQCSIVNNSSQARTGSYSLRIIADGGWHNTRQSVTIVDNHDYKIEGYIRSAGIANQGPRIRIRWYNSSSSLLKTENINGVTGTTGYVLYSKIATPPANAVRLEVAPMITANTPSGTAWFDDISVIDLEGPLTYMLTVNSGSGDGDYTAGTVVDITADAAPSGQVFDQWTGDVANVLDVNNPTTAITMPASNATVTATYHHLNMLDNPGFESGNNGDWNLGAQCSIVNNSSQAHTGNYSLRIIADGGWHNTRQSVTIVDNHDYKIEGYIRSAGIANQGPRIRIRWYNSSSSLLKTENINGVTGTTGYVLYSKIATPPANAVRLEVAPMITANTPSGTAWFDDMSVIDIRR